LRWVTASAAKWAARSARSITVSVVTSSGENHRRGKNAEDRLAVRQKLSRPLIEDLHAYMREQVVKLSRGHDLAKAFNYILKRWASFTLFLEDGRVYLSNNAAERGLRGIALGRMAVLRI